MKPPNCSTTSLDSVLLKQWKVLIRQCGCVGQSASFFLAKKINLVSKHREQTIYCVISYVIKR